MGWELYPPVVELAVPVASNCSVPRIFALPLMSNLATGPGVGATGKPMPTSVPLSKICEVLTSLTVSNFGTKFTVPPRVVTFGSVDALEEAVGADNRRAPEETPFDGPAMLPARAKAEGGKPPNVSASPALSAYGTLTSKTLACSSSCPTCIPSQRASPDANSSTGTPFALLAPSRTL